jgi:hypothetical protein
MSTAVHITWHGAQINFGDLPPYLTFDKISPRRLVSCFAETVERILYLKKTHTNDPLPWMGSDPYPVS